MKKIVALAILLLMTGVALAVVDQPEPEEGDMAITSAEPENYEYSFEVVEEDMNETDTGVTDYEVEEGKIEFRGVLEMPTPCHTLIEDIEDIDESYLFNIAVEDDADEEEACPQVITYQKYEASFDAEKPYSLEIVHEGETVEVIEISEDEETETEEGSLLGSVINWFRGLF